MTRFLTKSTTPIIGWIAIPLGLLMNGIFYVLTQLGIPNVGVAIILFTIILLMAMMPLQIRQQRFSKLNVLMQPELSKIQARYKGKKDPDSQQRMMDETQAIYAKYGVSPTGSCVQLLIQMPILFALYQVIYKIPGYITIIGSKISALTTQSAFAADLKSFVESAGSSTLTATLGDASDAQLIDTVYKLNSTQWTQLLDASSSKSYASELTDLYTYIKKVTSFCSLNISDSPMEILKSAWSDKAFLLIFAALLIPFLAWFTQWLNIKLMPQAASSSSDGDNSQMEATMKSMNTVMPLMSVVFCFTLPVGVGIYWIASAAIRGIQQFLINKHLERESVDEIIRKAQEKANKKREKEGLPPTKITNSAHISPRNVTAKEEANKKAQEAKNAANSEKVKASTAYYNENAKPGSIASKANMVARFDDKKKKK